MPRALEVAHRFHGLHRFDTDVGGMRQGCLRQGNLPQISRIFAESDSESGVGIPAALTFLATNTRMASHAHSC